MFSDNETSSDLLGFEDQVEDVCAIVLDTSMLPVTVGILGDWGSGKSSLLRMTETRLRDAGAVVVPFSPWRIETYDDAKSAFLDIVIEAVANELPANGDEAARDKVLEKLNRLRKRVRWLRAAGLAAKHIVTMSAPSLESLDGLLRDDTEEEAPPGTARLARDFHKEFEDVVAALNKPLVVLVDDLDRCLPEKVLDILQAIRLFLSVEGSAFVLATDERVVRDAVRLRYPQAAAASETDLPQEYLEKIVQVPLRIPPLGPAEVESYLNLLVAEKHLDPDGVAAVRDKAAQLRQQDMAAVCMNVGIARSCLPGGSLPAHAEADFELIGRIARLLASGLKGNPRQVKRFLNGLELRRRAVVRRGLGDVIDDAVLTKLAVLEYVQLRRFRLLYEWQAAADGRPPQLAAAESSVQSVPAGKAKAKAEGTRAASATSDPATVEWTENPWLRAWLALEPPLANVDLRPYFVLARDALQGSVAQARRLPAHLQTLLERLATEAQRDPAVAVAIKLPGEELALLVEAAIERLPSDADPMVLGIGLVDIAAAHPGHARSILDAVGDLPYGQIGFAHPTAIANRLKTVAAAEVGALLDAWESQTSVARLSRSALTARRIVSDA